MTTTLTPPPYGTPDAPPPGTPAPAPQGPPPARGSSRAVAIVAIVAGALVIILTGVGALLASLRVGAERSATMTAATSGLTDLSVDVSGAGIEIAFGAVTQATLDVVGTGGADGWTLARSGDELTVRYDRAWWDAWGWRTDRDRAVLTLPASLHGLDASLSVNGGSLQADGDFADLDLELNAGALTVDGSARTLEAEVNAGAAQVSLDDVTEATASVSAGQLSGKLTGTAPTTLSLDVSAGRVELAVPDEAYAVTSDVSAGRFTHTLTTEPNAPRHIHVTVSAGAVVLSPGRP